MFILLVILYMNSGIPEIRHSVVTGQDAQTICEAARPAYERLYKTGKFHDGPNFKDIIYIVTKCEDISQKSEFLYNMTTIKTCPVDKKNPYGLCEVN